MMLKNKKILITGIANKYSIAFGIARAMKREGAEIAIAYQNERLLKNITPIAEELGVSLLVECDVSSDESITKSAQYIQNNWLPLMDLCIQLALLQQINLKETL